MCYFLSKEFDYAPGVAYGGGGSSGAVGFPDYMEDIHKDWLQYVSSSASIISTDMIEVMEAALLSNPLEDLSYDDPGTDISEVKTEYDAWNTAVDALDEHSDWDDIVNNAVAQVDTAGVLNDIDVDNIASSIRTSNAETLADAVEQALAVLDTTVIQQAVQGYVSARRLDRAQLRTRYKANMTNVGAERSSAYALGMALLEIGFEQETGQFQSQLTSQMYQQGIQVYMSAFQMELSARIQTALAEKQTRDQFVSQGVAQMLQFKQFISELQKQLATVLSELHRVGFIMDSEYVANTADLNWKYASWDFETYQNGIAVLGGLGGGTAMPKGPTKAASAIGGALSGIGSGAAAGAAIGAAGGPIGATGGALIGGLMGLGAGLF